MRTPKWNPVLLTTDEQFSYVLSFEEDDQDPKHHFICCCGWSEDDYKPIANWYWFIAKITAFKGTVEICSTYMGANCYKTKSEVLGNGTIKELLSGYGPQMIEEVKQEAINALNEDLKL